MDDIPKESFNAIAEDILKESATEISKSITEEFTKILTEKFIRTTEEIQKGICIVNYFYKKF